MIKRFLDWLAAAKAQNDTAELQAGYDYAAGYILSTGGEDPRHNVLENDDKFNQGVRHACQDWEAAVSKLAP